MKVAILSAIYDKHLYEIYGVRNGLQNLSYKQQCLIIKDETVTSIGEWPDYFSKIDVKCIVLCRNNFFAQSKWCAENRYDPCNLDPEFDIIREQLFRFKPTHLIVMDPPFYNENKRHDKIQECCPSLKINICWYGAPIDKLSILKKYDKILSPSIQLTNEVNKYGYRGMHLNHAFEPRILNLIPKSNNRINKLCFIGSLNSGNEWYDKRISFLEKISSEFKIDIYSDVQKISYYQAIKRRYIFFRQSLCKVLLDKNFKNKIILHYSDKNNLPQYDRLSISPIANNVNPPRHGLDMLKLLSSYKFTFNMHIPLSGSTAGNLRLTEALGVGTCLLTDYKINNGEFLNKYVDYCSYKSVEEFIDKYQFLMNNLSFVDQISNDLMQHTLAFHNTSNQFDNLLYLITKNN